MNNDFTMMNMKREIGFKKIENIIEPVKKKQLSHELQQHNEI